MKKAILLIGAIALGISAASAQTTKVHPTPASQLQLLGGVGPVVAGSANYSQLPIKARNFLSANFPSSRISKIEKEFDTNEYDVYLDEGIEIEFTAKGEVKELDGNGRALPQSTVKNLLPGNVSKAIETSTALDDIEKIEIGSNSVYEIEFVKNQQFHLKKLKVNDKGKILSKK